MFVETPTDDISQNKNNLSFLDTNNSLGYYNPKLNEVLNDKYKIIGLCGKGIFSTVVKVVDFYNKEFALKIVRNIGVMLISGEKERSIIKKLNEIDKYGKIFLKIPSHRQI